MAGFDHAVLGGRDDGVRAVADAEPGQGAVAVPRGFNDRSLDPPNASLHRDTQCGLRGLAMTGPISVI
jgi:hypothetical protein